MLGIKQLMICAQDHGTHQRMWIKVFWIDLFDDGRNFFAKRFVGKKKPFLIIGVNLPGEIGLFKFSVNDALEFVFVNKWYFTINDFLFYQEANAIFYSFHWIFNILIIKIHSIFQPGPIPI